MTQHFSPPWMPIVLIMGITIFQIFSINSKDAVKSDNITQQSQITKAWGYLEITEILQLGATS